MLFPRDCSGFHFVENLNFNLPFTVFTPHLTVLVPFFFSHRAAFNFLHSRVRHLLFICLCLVLSPGRCGVLPSICVSPLALAPIFAQIHRAASAPRPSVPSRACRSICLSRSAPNPPASPCRPSKTGECHNVTAPTERFSRRQQISPLVGLCRLSFLLTCESGAAAGQLCVCRPNFPFHCRITSSF